MQILTLNNETNDFYMKTKKELKEEYKQKKSTMGVFQILNKETGKLLIEGTTNIPSKWNRHRTELRFGSHRNKQLQNDWNTLGEANFEFSILSELKIEEDEIVDVNKELKILKEMVEEEMNIQEDMKY